ncbi:hypothetical protein NKH77_45935 [Streptomyces sp. M19]
MPSARWTFSACSWTVFWAVRTETPGRRAIEQAVSASARSAWTDISRGVSPNSAARSAGSGPCPRPAWCRAATAAESARPFEARRQRLRLPRVRAPRRLERAVRPEGRRPRTARPRREAERSAPCRGRGRTGREAAGRP